MEEQYGDGEKGTESALEGRSEGSLVMGIKEFIPQGIKEALYRARNRIITIKLKADSKLRGHKLKYYCPCCDIRLRSFVNGGYDKRPSFYNPERYKNTNQDIQCPICISFPRHRILARWMEKHKGIIYGEILYFAPEKGISLWLKRNGIEYTTADLFKKADLKIDIENTGLLDASYDIIIANHVLEHVDDFRKALKEMYRILRPNGCFICSFPMDPKVELLDEEEEPLTPEERLRRFGQNDHKRVFGMKADKFLTEAGFDVETIRGEDYPEEILPVVGPADYDMNILFCCREPVKKSL